MPVTLSLFPMLGLVEATTLLCGIAPVLEGARRNLAGILSGVHIGGNTSHRRLRSALVIGQVAVATMLIALAVLMMRSLDRITTLEPGFSFAPEPNAETVVAVPLDADVGEIPGEALIQSNMLACNVATRAS